MEKSNNSRHLFDYIVQAISPAFGEGEAKNIAFILLEEKAQLNKSQILMQDPTNLSIEDLTTEIKLLQNQTPIQYILSKAHFYGRDFYVSPSVLIPRPETEEIVYHIIQKHKRNNNLSILDIGTGSGCIPITLDLELEKAKVYTVDISQEALEVASKNNQILGSKVSFSQKDILSENLNNFQPLDIIVSNPPYVLNKEKALMHANVLEHEPHLALFVPDNAPLLFYERIAKLAYERLKKNGWLYFEINENFGEETAEMLLKEGFEDIRVIEDMQGKKRMTEAQKR